MTAPFKLLTILGSTGSIGTNTLDVVRQNRDRFGVFALAAGSNVHLLRQQIAEFQPKVVVLSSERSSNELLKLLPEAKRPEILTGPKGLSAVATAPETQIVISAIVGVAGLEATYEAIKAHKRVGLANKETLVSAGQLVMEAVRSSGSELIPVDSEHNGAHQCLRAGRRGEVTKLILTASGGPFRNTPKSALSSVTPSEALNHPTWKMGNRITIDSATLMNKGFEVIEACWLFDFAPGDVEVVVHPQSTVHAMVEFNDGSVLAQISATDMRMPIQYALTWPERAHAPVPKIDWTQARKWEFCLPDFDKFPLLKLAYQAQEAGRSATCTLNAADEVAVDAFLKERIGFSEIAELVAETLASVPGRQPKTISDILEIDNESREMARRLVERRAKSISMSHPVKT